MFILKPSGSVLYLLLSIIVHTIAEYTGSLIYALDILSSTTGIHIKHGNFKFSLAESKNCFVLTDHHTNTAHSGSIQSFQMYINSSLIYLKISSYLAVVI